MMFVCLFVCHCLFVCFRLPPWPVSGCDVCLFVSDCRRGQSLVVMFVCLFEIAAVASLWL